jgi:hypothetical protein
MPGHVPLDPCEPPYPSHLPRGPAQIIGRIRHHGTRRLAHRLHPALHGCLAGPPLLLSTLVMKAALPAIAFTALTAAGAGIYTYTGTSTDTSATPEQGSFPSGSLILTGNGAGGTGPGSSTHPTMPGHHHKPMPIPEPATLCVLLAAALAFAGLRRWLKPA